MNSEIVNPIYQTTEFWISVGCLIYFSGNFFFYVLINSASTKDEQWQLRSIYAVVTLIKDIVLALSVLSTNDKDEIENGLGMPDDLEVDSVIKSLKRD